jgi:hypothetical protein
MFLHTNMCGTKLPITVDLYSDTMHALIKTALKHFAGIHQRQQLYQNIIPIIL